MKKILIAFLLLVPGIVAAEKLPDGMKLMDPIKTVDALRVLKLEKDEYESSDAFDARLLSIAESLGRRQIYKGAPVGPRYSFVLADLSTTYNPDLQSLTVSSDGWVWASMKKAGSYVAANAFNRKVVVQKQIIRHIGICGYRYLSGFAFTPERAKEIRPNLKALVTISLSPPIYGEDEEVQTPTIDVPTEILFQSRCINGKDVETVIYNSKTGEILAREQSR